MTEPPRARRVPHALRAAVALAVFVTAVGVAWGVFRPRLTGQDVSRVVLMTLAQEAEASFLVAGTLTFGTTIEETTTTRVLPGLLDLSVGARRATVHVPARVAYGFDVRHLRPEAIRLADDGVVEVDLPALAVFSVEPVLEDAQIRAGDEGWMRLSPTGGRAETQRALAALRPALRTRAERHVATASQPRANAARAVARMLTPPLVAAGMPAPTYRIRIGEGAVLTLDGATLDPRS